MPQIFHTRCFSRWVDVPSMRQSHLQTQWADRDPLELEGAFWHLLGMASAGSVCRIFMVARLPIYTHMCLTITALGAQKTRLTRDFSKCSMAWTLSPARSTHPMVQLPGICRRSTRRGSLLCATCMSLAVADIARVPESQVCFSQHVACL